MVSADVGGPLGWDRNVRRESGHTPEIVYRVTGYRVKSLIGQIVPQGVSIPKLVTVKGISTPSGFGY